VSEHIDDPELDRCLAEDLAALHTGLDRVLDLDAGLADATLPGRAQAYTDDLDQVLDLDAGLAAILPTGQPPDSTSRRDSRTARPGDLGTEPATADTREVAELLRFARTLASMPAAARLHVRLWLPRQALSEIRLLVSVDRSTREDLRTRADALADASARALDQASALDHTSASAVDFASASASALARDLAYDLDLVRALNRALNRARISFPGGMTSQKKSEFVRAVAADQAAEDLREKDFREAVEIMDRVVSDVVGADLGNVDLTGIPLEGVRWSSTTRWLPAWRDRVHDRSVQIDLDLWEVGREGIDTDHLVTMT